MHEESLTAVAESIRAGKLSPVEAAERCLQRVRKWDGRIRAFITLDEEGALRSARVLEAGGHAWQSDQMALMLPVHIGETGAAARDAMRPGVRKYYENLRAIFSALPDSYAEHLPRLKIIEDTLASVPYEKFFRDQAVFGDVAEVIDRLQAAVEAPRWLAAVVAVIRRPRAAIRAAAWRRNPSSDPGMSQGGSRRTSRHTIASTRCMRCEANRCRPRRRCASRRLIWCRPPAT